VLVPGNAWTGAHSWTQNWYGTPNSVAMLDIVDPGNNFAFDVHQYLDTDSSGGSSTIVSPTIGQERLVQFTNWLHTNNRRGFLGEFAVANSRIGTSASQIGDEAIHNMMTYMEANADVWLGWTWWAAGPWWQEYMFTAEPTNLGQPHETDRASLDVLQPHFAGASPPGDFNRDGAVDTADFVIWRKTLNQNVRIGTGADADHDGIVEPADVALWQQQFGAGGTGGGAASNVPEPASMSLGLLGCLAALRAWRRVIWVAS
jgi:hypothetical protein